MANFSIKSFLHLVKKHKDIQGYDMSKLCFNLGFDCLGEGSSRLVYAINKKCVIKIATSKAGLAQNRAEAKICNHPKSKGRVTRVLRVGSNFGWLIVERVDKHLRDHAWRCNWTATREHCFNYGYGKDFDLKEVEIGILNGRKVAVDYGGTNHVMKDHY